MAAPGTRRISRPLLALLLAGVIGAVFWPVLTFDFVRWDDDINVTENALMTGPWSPSLVARFFDGGTALRFKPLHWLIFRLVAEGFGFNPVAWHALNLALHVIAGALAFLVLRRIFALVGGASRGGAADGWAWIAAAVWALHPLRAEPAAWVTASPYPLTTVCLLGSFYLYLGAHRDSPRPPDRVRLAGAWLLAVAAYASYPVGATYGLWLIVVDLWLLGIAPGKPGDLKDGRVRGWWIKHGVFLAPALLAVAITLWSRVETPGIFVEAPSLASHGLGNRVLMALATIAYFPSRIFWPVNLTPNVPPFYGGLAGQWLVPVLALTTTIALLVAWRCRAHRGAATVVFGLVALSVPCLGLTERPMWPVDRYSYLVDLVVIGGLAGGVMTWSRAGWRTRAVAAGGVMAMVVLVACAWSSRRQIMIWRDTDTLFAHMERTSGFAENPLQQGYIYYLWGRHAALSAQPARAAQLLGRAQHVYLEVIKAAVAEGDYVKALGTLTHVETRFGLTPVMRREKGAWLLRISRPDEALRELHRAKEILADDARVRALIEEAEAAGAVGAGRRQQ